MPEPIENLRKVRLEKLKKIRELGFDPYPSSWEKLKNRQQAVSIRQQELGTKVVMAGRIMALRTHGGITFADLSDESAQIQLVLESNQLSTTNYQLLLLLDIGDFVGVEGPLFKTKAGELSIEVKDLKLLSKSLRPLPSTWYGLKDVEERYRRRYLDLIMNKQVREVFEIRTKVIQEIRDFLNRKGFIEVETPVLQPIYGGASARPFITHHNVLDFDLFLRISDELYLKRLIVGGFEKVYEFGKDFRNEGIDRQHNPEFTQVEFYWAYVDYDTLMQFTEEMLSEVIQKVLGVLQVEHQGTVLNFKPPWKRVTFRDLLLENTGLDIDEINSEDKLKEAIQEKEIHLDLTGVVGFGALVDQLYKETARPKLIQPTFLLDYPAEMIDLAKRKENDPTKIASMQLLVKGFELIKAYNELNDPIDQRKRWEESEKLAERGLEEHEVLDRDYIQALEYGMPPTAGWGMGVDRLVSFLTNQRTLKDVILFPTMRSESIRS